MQGDQIKKGQIMGFIEQLGTYVPVEVRICLLWSAVLLRARSSFLQTMLHTWDSTERLTEMSMQACVWACSRLKRERSWTLWQTRAPQWSTTSPSSSSCPSLAATSSATASTPDLPACLQPIEDAQLNHQLPLATADASPLLARTWVISTAHLRW